MSVDWISPVVAAIAGGTFSTGLAALRTRLVVANNLDRRVRHLESSRDRQAKIITVLVHAQAKVASARREGQSSEQLIEILIEANMLAVKELAETVL